jgi:hypothetical protein
LGDLYFHRLCPNQVSRPQEPCRDDGKKREETDFLVAIIVSSFFLLKIYLELMKEDHSRKAMKKGLMENSECLEAFIPAFSRSFFP